MPDSRKRILIVAGEASADRYGARLVEKLIQLRGAHNLHFYGTGGDEMQRAGVELLCHIRDLAHIGVREALANLRTYYQTFRRITNDALRHPPSLAVLLDFAEFNLRLAKKMKRMGVPVIYYISPQIWAWRSGRLKTIRKYVDKMLVILPFEEEYYRRRGMEVEFVGHPLLEELTPLPDRDDFMARLGLDPGRKTVAILAGSRRKEIDYILPVLLRASRLILEQLPAQFLISVAPTIDVEHVAGLTQRVLNEGSDRVHFHVVSESARAILAGSDFGFVKSGTCSLEAALVGTPFLITYKISPFSWCIGSLLIHAPMKGLVNLIAGEEIVPELLQGKAKPQELARVCLKFLRDPQAKSAMQSRLADIRQRLGSRVASEAAAMAVSAYL